MMAGAPNIVEDSSQFHSASPARALRPYLHDSSWLNQVKLLVC